MESLFLTRDQALSLWSGSTDSKTQDYQRTNPWEYQILRIHTKETTWIQDPASPNHQQHPVKDASSKQQTKQKYKLNYHTGYRIIIQETAYRIATSLSLAHQRKNKQTNKNSAQILPYIKFTQNPEPTLGGKKPKGKKNSILKSGKRRPQTQ